MDSRRHPEVTHAWSTCLAGMILNVIQYLGGNTENQCVPPEVMGRLISWLVDIMIPKSPVLPPSELFHYPGMEHFNLLT